jgi:hypothetical protein
VDCCFWLERIETVLKDGAKEQRVQTQLLEQIANENIINPRRLRGINQPGRSGADGGFMTGRA